MDGGYDDIFAPVDLMTALRVLLSIAVNKKMLVHDR